MELVPAGFILDRRPARPCSSGERGRPPSRARPPERGCDWGRRLERGTAGLGRVRLERGATGGSERESTLATARRFILSLILHGFKKRHSKGNLKFSAAISQKLGGGTPTSVTQGLFGRRPGHPRPFRPEAGHSRPAAKPQALFWVTQGPPG